MCKFKWIVKLLIVIGAINIGSMGVANYDLIGSFVSFLFGQSQEFSMHHAPAARVVFVIIGLAGLMGVWCLIKSLCCSSDSCNKDKGSGGGCCGR
jgi:uncharacterized membrane protein YuzA (DUF378 family)